MIHPTAVVDRNAEVDSSVEVGPFCQIGPRVKIGSGTKLLSHVVLDGDTQVGSHNTIYPFSVLGAIPQDLKYKGEPTQLVIGDGNTIRESVTMNLGTLQGGGLTQVGNNNLLMAYVHLGHDCIVKNNCIIANYAGLAGHVTIEDFSNLAGMVGVSQFVQVGAHAYIGGQSGLEKSVPPFCIVFGNRPAAIRGTNIVGMRRHGYSADIISKVNEAIKLWIRPEVPMEQCLLEIESQYGEVTEIGEFLSFIRKSKSGVCK